jgi:ATP-dependent DNA helicase RecG
MVNHFIHRDYTVMGSEVHLDVYDDRLAITSPGGMYSGQTVQDLSLEEIASDRRNPILADVMAQLNYMEKRGSGLKRICNEAKALDGYKDELKPVFRSTSSQFMTTIYSMGYEPKSQQDEQYQDGIKPGLSWEQVGTKIGLGWDEVEKLFIALQEPRTMTELKELYQWSNTTKFRAKYVSPLIDAQFVGMVLPNKPTSPKLRYFLTDDGKALLANATRNPDTSGLVEKVHHMLKKLSEEEKRIALELLNKE